MYVSGPRADAPRVLHHQLCADSNAASRLIREYLWFLRYAPIFGGPMPTVLRIGPYRLFFYASDRGEPPHVHVERGDDFAKFWLDPVRLQASGGFRRAELRHVQRLVERNRERLLRSWDDYFNE